MSKRDPPSGKLLGSVLLSVPLERVMTTTTFDMNDLKRRMQGAIASLKQELSGLRTGGLPPRCSTMSRSKLWQPHAAQSTRLDQRAGSAAAQRAGLDRSMVHAVEKAISAANFGLDAVDRRGRCCGFEFRSSTRSGGAKS